MKFIKLSKLKFIRLFLQADVGSVKCRSQYAHKTMMMTICLYYAWIRLSVGLYMKRERRLLWSLFALQWAHA